MRILLAFALVAAATASPQKLEPIQLQAAPEPEAFESFVEPSFEPLFIPQDVADAYARELELNPPLETIQFVDQPEDFSKFIEPIKFVDSVVEDILENANVQFAENPEEFDQTFVHPLMYGSDDEAEVAQEENPAAINVLFAEQPEETADVSNVEIAEDFDQAYAQPLAYAFQEIPVEVSNVESEVVADSPVQFVEVAENVESPARVDLGVPDLEENFQPQELPNPKVYDNDMVR